MLDSPELWSAPPRDVLDEQGSPRFGAYAGSFGRVDLSGRNGGLQGMVRSLMKRKRWVYGLVSTGEVACAFAIVDLSYATSAFGFAVDLKKGELLEDVSVLGLPGSSTAIDDLPGEGLRASLRRGGSQVRIDRPMDASDARVELSLGELRLQASLALAKAPTPLAAVLPLVGGGVDCTQKTNLVPVQGTLRAGGRTFALDGGLSGLDYTQGHFARRTAWRWAFAHGTSSDGIPLGFNLTSGLSDASRNENVLWVGGQMIALPPPRFSYDAARPLEPWVIDTGDGAVSLRFSPKGRHEERRRLGLVSIRFLQVAGIFEGTIRDRSGRTITIDSMAGVTEDQRVRW